MAEQFGDAHLLGSVVLHDQQALASGLGIFLDLRQRRADALGRRRLVDEGERTARQRMLTVFVERDDLHRNVPRQRIVLELAQHGPAQHVRQEHVERNRRRLELLGEFERLGAAAGDQHLEALVAGQIDQHPRITRIVFDDQEDAISRFEVEAVVRQLFDDPLLGSRCLGEGRRGRGTRCNGGTGICQRQIEHEGAALAGRAAQVNFAAEQARQFAADGKAEAGAAVFPAGAGVRLLERLEDQLLFLQRNADAGVGHLEGDDGGRVIEDRVLCAPAADGGRYVQLHAALRGELERVRQ